MEKLKSTGVEPPGVSKGVPWPGVADGVIEGVAKPILGVIDGVPAVGVSSQRDRLNIQ